MRITIHIVTNKDSGSLVELEWLSPILNTITLLFGRAGRRTNNIACFSLVRPVLCVFECGCLHGTIIIIGNNIAILQSLQIIPCHPCLHWRPNRLRQVWRRARKRPLRGKTLLTIGLPARLPRQPLFWQARCQPPNKGQLLGSSTEGLTATRARVVNPSLQIPTTGL